MTEKYEYLNITVIKEVLWVSCSSSHMCNSKLISSWSIVFSKRVLCHENLLNTFMLGMHQIVVKGYFPFVICSFQQKDKVSSTNSGNKQFILFCTLFGRSWVQFYELDYSSGSYYLCTRLNKYKRRTYH